MIHHQNIYWMDGEPPSDNASKMGKPGIWIWGLLAAAAASAQPRVNDANFHGWWVYAGDHPVSDRWGAHLEAQWRRHDGGLRPQQLLLRPALNYRWNGRVTLSAGYAYVNTSRYGDYPAASAFGEHRIYQQALARHAAGRIEVQHRGRLEQRWLERTGGPWGWRYQNRVRYMARASTPISEAWFAVAANEIFLNIRPLDGVSPFDQNRAFAGLGKKLGRHSRFEAGYMQQTLLQRSRRVMEWSHTLHFGLYSTLPFGKQ